MHTPADRLLEVAEEVTALWARTLLQRTLGDHDVDDAQLANIIEEVRTAVRDGLHTLMATDPEQQRTNPLTIFRRATAPITALLTELKLSPIHRDEFEQRSFPEDLYGLYPATWVDISEKLVEPGLEWGAWKAAVVISRHKNNGTNL